MVTFILWLVVVSRTAALSRGCDTRADVAFLIDSSDTVGQINFNKQIDFLKDVTNKLNVGQDQVHVSALTFSSGVHNSFYLNDHVAKSDVLHALSGIQYFPGNADTGDAIKFTSQQSFSQVHGARGNVPHIAVLLTDGPSTTTAITKLQAQTAKDNNAVIYTVGVGSGVDVDELTSVSSNPDLRYSMFADNYDTLRSLSDMLATKICNELPPDTTTLPIPTGCLHKADVVFMLDSSTSVGSEDFQKTQNFLKNIITNMDVGHDKVQVGVMQYSSYPTMGFPLILYNNTGDVLNAVENLKMMNGGTNTADAIKFTTDEMFFVTNGARSNVSRIAILLTNGGTMDSHAAINAADVARQAGIGINVVSIGNNTNQHEINAIANQPSESHVMTVSNFDQLEQKATQILNQACNVTSAYNFASSAAVTCGDKISNCNEYGSTVCRDYPNWAEINCKKTCGRCPYQYAINFPTCTNKLTNCESYGKAVCTSHGNWAQDNCPLYCGFCGAVGSSNGFYGMCNYKGKTYQTGEKWNDGCDYECVCSDGRKGTYKCYNRCPLYYNLPSMCTLVKKEGECCLQPVCNFNPSVARFNNSAMATTASGIPVCSHKSKLYYQGQTWKDACQYQCTCTDASKGLYTCEQLCPTYSILPAGCHLQQNPGSCCHTPRCEFNQQQGSYSGYGFTSGSGTAENVKPPEPCVDVATNCKVYGKSVCINYSQWASDNCRKYCDICQNLVVKPAADDVCIYRGKTYQQGQSWEPDCSTRCTCENAHYGYYRCNEACPHYNNLPSICNTVKRGGCCPVVECQAGVFYTSSQNIDSIGNGGLITVQHPPANQIQNPPYGQTQIGSGGTGFMAPSLRGCLYNGQIYERGQMWDDGCKYTCTCMNDVTGEYKCREKCPSYPNLTSACVMITDTNDPCCKVPKCGFDVATGQLPIPVPSYNQTSIGVGIVKPPVPTLLPNLSHNGSWVLLNTTGAQPAAPTAPANVKQGFCIYKDQRYNAGETWDDGCDYNCVCDDGVLGHYKCISKCRTFDYVPQPQCRLIQDPSNPCCQIAECRLNLHHPEIEGQRTTPRVQGNKFSDYCLYNGEQYQQGQSWYDGCSYKCTCEDAEKGIYRCLSRCPEILNAEPGCNYITDPRDPTCCRVPDCTPVNITNPHPIPPKTYQGQIVGTSGNCVYKGSEYRAGDSWEDGCDLTCTCTDALRGHYECIDRCPVYTNLPDTCRMVNDFTNPCCKKPDCNIHGQSGGIGGSISTTRNPALPQTLPPKQQYCVYKSAQYLQGQSWEDGCNYKCRCDDSSRGIYTCNQRCASFSSLTPGCTMKVDPKDSCCLVEVCLQPTARPHQITPVPTIQLIPFTGKVNLPTSNPVTGQGKPTPIGFCVYKSVIYTQGQTWDDGCDYTCDCYDAEHGKYRCTPKCPSYIDLPTACRLHKDPANPCCDIVDCTEPTPTPTTIPTTQHGSTSQAPHGNSNPRPATSITPPTTPVSRCTCEYKGQQYIQGQQWFDGCDFSCVCEDCVTGVYRCNHRCPTFQTPRAECSLVADPKDPLCCKIPECPNAGNYNTAPPLVIQGGKATPNPTTSIPTYTPVQPTPFPPIYHTAHVYTESYTPPNMYITTPQQPPTWPPINIPNTCLYKGKSYSQGQRWQDGCDYDCVCEDQITGVYKCTEKCRRITNLNPGCQLVQDINDPCCKKAYCSPNVSPIVIKPPKPTTLDGRSAVCMYKGMNFKQGETWKDGCDLVCICENGTTGFYRCDDRCAVYQLPNGCAMKTDPADSCCKKPVCQPELMKRPTVSPTPRPTPGEILSPTPSPTPYTLPMPIGVNYGSGPNGGRGCLYKGVSYNVGQTWKDGCFYTCECLDMQTGRYRCKDRCPALDGVVPPPTCQIVSDPSDVCCKMLQCQNPTHTPAPTFNITNGTRPHIPDINTTAPSYVTTSVPNLPQTTPEYTSPVSKNICIMNGLTYSPGQTWYDGCSRVCVCEDGRTGYYRCRQRCNTYDSLPSSCTLVPDPKDPSCCQIPLCATPTPGSNQPVTIKGQAGSFTGYGAGLPQPNTAKSKVCVFNGLAYKTGERWQDGCKYICVCEDGSTGRYKCTERCPAFPRLSPGCTLQTDPNDYCCKVAVCRQTTTPSPRQPTSPPTKPPSFCVYNGAAYTQGQTWEDGCSTTCRCDDADNNIYNCFDRCPHYPDLPAGCIKSADPNDPCCLVPVCSTPKPITYNPLYPTTTANPNQSTTPYNPYVTPLPKGEIVGYNPITQNTYTLSPKPTYCVYKGKQYTNNQTWQDGCHYNCECIDQATGRYRCTERCPTFPLQSNCFMVPSQTDNCCQVQYCPPPKPNTTPVPNPEQLTTVPLIPIPQPKQICIYDGKTYTQGQTWYDGCDQKCVCDNGKTGHYTCTPRCLHYQAGTQCIMVPDPQDPHCCMVPQCPQNNTLSPVIIGIQTPTTPATAQTTTPGPNGSVILGTTPVLHMCVYKGQMYQQDQKWQDGCDYSCECVNSTTGRYQCMERCPNSNQIPLICKLKYNPDDPCCPLPDCPSIMVPNPLSSVSPTAQPPPIPALCVYNGVPYRQGQSWDVDCEKTCRCDDARNNQINCDERCPNYPPPKPGCRLVTDPSDRCCQARICIDLNSTNPFTVVSGNKGTFTGMPQQPVSGQPSIPQIYGTMMCVYRGKAYSQGQKWDDGCQFQCECIDQQTGRYKCTERCARLPQVPSYCTLTQDPDDACCQSVYCPIQPTAVPTKPGEITPSNQFTPPPPLAICIYNRQAYRQDQEWFDGCDKKCVCVNATTGYYRCQQRCNVYTNVSSVCTLVPDPSDPTCCKAPSCPVVEPGAAPISPGLIKPLQAEYGTITGNAIPPTEHVPTILINGNPQAVKNGSNVTPAPRRGCFFKDTIYRKGEKWQDGCEYNCECIDDMNGRYKCTERCQKFPNLPYYCVLVQDPNNDCCGIPYCGNPNNPTPLSNIPTQYQVMAQTTPTYINPNQPRPFNGTNSPTQTNGYCVYKGVYYRQGQTWSDGCDKICTCDDVKNNLFSCRSRCPQFSHIPDTCQLVADQNDPCCLVPDCHSGPSHSSGSPQPVYYLTPIINPGFSGQSNVGPNNPLSTLINAATGACVYKGKIYQQNQKWQDGCQLTCQCLDALRGQYKCTYTCPQYYNLPWYCTYEQDPNNTCCQRVRCDESKPSITQTTVTISSTHVSTTQETTTPPGDMCRYSDNTVHAQGATWEDGCTYRCICIDAKINNYRCTARCRVYSGLPSYCTLERDPADTCCRIPKCNSGTINLQPVYNNMSGAATPPPNAIDVVPIGSHNTIYGSSEVRPGAVHPFTSGGGYHACIYKGSVYKQGDSWQDGCNYVCTCDNAQKGEYKCVSRCPIYPSALPTYCRKVAIPGQCCPKLSCDIPGINGSYIPQSEVQITPAPTNLGGLIVTPAQGDLHVQGSYVIATNPPQTMTTAFPGQGYPISQSQITNVRAQCIFPTKNGQQYLIYNEGEQWNDGCDYTCTCKDGASGYYECIASCPTYNNLVSNRCYMLRIDGKCCSEPRCILADGRVVNPMKYQTSFPIVPSLSGGYVNFRPDTNYTALETGGTAIISGVRNVCIYKGRQYHQGQFWNDGCNFNCRCDDASTGQFSCTPRCPVYTELPSFCSLDTVPGECCKKLNCRHVVSVGTTATPKPTKPSCDWCKDTLSNCESYGQQACVDPYIPWAKRNCANYCNLCQYDCTNPPPTTTPTTSQCPDKLDNCEEYGKDSCTGIFKPWATENCPAFCGYCNTSTATASTCHDASPVCSQLDSNICTSSVYKSWAQTNCMKTCHACSHQAKSCRYTDGVTHAHGSWWQDGCSADAKNCTCNNGIVKCLKLCPSFENLPSGWQIKHVTGQCCPIITMPPTNLCHYNGTSYKQDETWRDGCKLSCRCTNAQQGLYQCQELCPQLDLPEICHWEEAPPGKCCRRPICPPIVVITGYPDV